MQLLAYLGCFLLGALCAGALARLKKRPGPANSPPAEYAEDEQPPERVLRQWSNFLSYSGSERGQQNLED